jgi:hypothetical protein
MLTNSWRNAMTEADWSKFNLPSMWRDWIVKSEQQWSESLTQMMKNERAGGLLNKQVDEARMMQRMFAEMAQMSLAAANLPSRSDIESLDERLGRVEDGLAAVSAALVQLRSSLEQSGTAAPARPRPARDRKPARKAAPKE